MSIAPLRLMATAVLAGTLTACGGGAPASPDTLTPAPAAATVPAIAPATASAAVLAKADPVEFSLQNGTFTLEVGSASLIGTYEGRSVQGSGPELASLTLDVTGGTGSFTGATGVLTADGRGAFAGEGAFQITVTGEVEANGQKRVRIKAKGQSGLSCGSTGPVLAMSGSGSAGNLGEASVQLTHEIAGAFCAP